ncbi:MAG: zinc ribbon domain-containing protein [Candidatus Lokiarchaeota archaeon]|nr:zinc ribbon domain-containing protein [Candidatus Lokiarchaeota archaeon]
MAKYCVYCGNPIKSEDKFCIICGKPVLAGVKKPEKTEVEKAKDLIKDKRTHKEKIIEESFAYDDDENLSETPDKKSQKKKDKKDEDVRVEKPLPFEVKEQMVLNIEYNDIKLNKEILVDKLKEIQKEIKDPRYDVDEEYNKSINIKVTAIKTLISELKQKESELEPKMDKPFIVQRIQDDIDKKIYQLKNLSKEFKLHKVDKDSFEKLREKYKEEKSILESERHDLVVGMKLWIKELKMEKIEIHLEKNLNKGRFSAKEITEDVYQVKNKEFEIKVKKIDLKIKTLEDLTK